MDGSPGSGVNLASLAPPETFTTDGPHMACGTVADFAENTSAPGCLLVQVDASPPTLEVDCPMTAAFGSPAAATVIASDGQSGLAIDPSGSVPIDTSVPNSDPTVTRTAVDNVGHETTASCNTHVVYSKVLSGPITKMVAVKAGEGVEIAPGAKVSANVTVRPGAGLDIEDAVVSGSVKAAGAGAVRICGSTVAGSVAVKGGGSVVIGDGTSNCPADTIDGATNLTSNLGNVLVDGRHL